MDLYFSDVNVPKDIACEEDDEIESKDTSDKTIFWKRLVKEINEQK